MSTCKFILFILTTLLIVSNEIEAQKHYALDFKSESIFLGTGSGLLLSAYLIDKQKDPIKIEQILALDKLDVPGFDRKAIDNYSNSAKVASDVFKNGFIAVPLSLFLSEKGRKNYKEIGVMYSEVAAINLGFTVLIKASKSRFRPYAYNQNVDIEERLKDDVRRSFFSGHTSHVSSMSFFTASVFSDLYPESKYRYAVWAGAITAPAVTAYLRVKAGRHFSSDVMVGYGVGALIGYFIPKLHKIDALEDVTIHGSSNGIGLSYTF